MPSSPHKVLVVIGTAPEAIKMLPLMVTLRRSRHVEPIVVATGQHPGVVENVLRPLRLADATPAVNLDVVTRYGDRRAAKRIVAAFEHIAFNGPQPTSFGSGFDRLDVLRAGGFDEDPHAVFTASIPERIALPETHDDLMEDVDVR